MKLSIVKDLVLIGEPLVDVKLFAPPTDVPLNDAFYKAQVSCLAANCEGSSFARDPMRAVGFALKALGEAMIRKSYP
jgi:hypothetical protein